MYVACRLRSGLTGTTCSAWRGWCALSSSSSPRCLFQGRVDSACTLGVLNANFVIWIMVGNFTRYEIDLNFLDNICILRTRYSVFKKLIVSAFMAILLFF